MTSPSAARADGEAFLLHTVDGLGGMYEARRVVTALLEALREAESHAEVPGAKSSEVGVQSSLPPTPSAAAIEAAARVLWQMGNLRIGERPWENVGEHYLREARAAIDAYLDASATALSPERIPDHPDVDRDPDWTP